MNRRLIAPTTFAAVFSRGILLISQRADAQIFSRRAPAPPAQAQIPAAPVPQATPAPPLGPKQPGKIRVGIVLMKVDLGEGFKGADAATPIRNTLLALLSGPAIEVAPLTSRIPQQIALEAKATECDFVLYTTLTQKHGSTSGIGSMLAKAAPLASMIPMVGMVGGMGGVMAGAIAGQAASAAMSTAASLPSGIKAKDEVTFEYRVAVPGSANSTSATVVKAKATRNGEDVITPLIENAASAVLAEVTKQPKQ